MNRFLTTGAALLLTQVLMACTDPIIIEGCAPSDEIHIICGFERPEDLEPLGDHPWILISELGSADIPGQIVALNVDDGTMTRLEASVAEPDPTSAFPRCGPPPDRLRPRGFHVSDLADGGFRRLVSANGVDQGARNRRILSQRR